MQKSDGIYTREMKHLKGSFEMADISGLCSLLPRHYTLMDRVMITAELWGRLGQYNLKVIRTLKD